MTYKALQIWFYAALSLALLSNPAWPAEKEGIRELAAKDAALSYLRSLPHDGKIYVWPTWRRPYEVVADHLDVGGSIARYKVLRGDLNGLFPAIGTAQISIISGDGANWQNDIKSALVRSALLPSYKDFVATAKVGQNGCTAYKFLSRDTWASVGVILINETVFREKGEAVLDGCVHAALDYLQGFPTTDRYFDYLTLPDATIRGLVLEAIYKCAAEGEDGTSEPEERTRDGLTPLPSLDCIMTKVAE